MAFTPPAQPHSQILYRHPTPRFIDGNNPSGARPSGPEGFIGDGYFQDGFVSGDMLANGNGFQWAGRKGQLGTKNFLTSVIKKQDDNLWYAVYNNADLTSGGASNGNLLTDNPNPAYYDAKSNSTSLRARFPAGTKDTGEQGIYHTGIEEIWIAYQVKIPDNWAVPTGSSPNNKWLQWWCGTNAQYDVAGTTQFSMNTYADGSISGQENLHVNCKDGTDGVYNGETIASNFYDANDAGKWMHLAYRFKCSSAGNAADGACEIYRKWDGDASYAKIVDQQNLKLAKTPNSAGLQAGYLLGYANRTYAADTEFIIDDFELSLTKPSVLP